MLDRVIRHLYKKMGSRYALAFLAIQGPLGIVVALITIGVIALYYDPPLHDALVVIGVSSIFTVSGILFALIRQQADVRLAMGWLDREQPSTQETLAAWDLAANLTKRSFRRDSPIVNGIAAVPSVVVFALVIELPWYETPVVLAAGLLGAAYGTVLSYSVSEALLRPLLCDISAALPSGFEFERRGLPLHSRLGLALPVFTALTGLTVVALVTDSGGTGLLLGSLAASLAVGIGLSAELAALLARSIGDPIAELGTALTRVRAGDYSARVPVVSSDELGEVSAAFNLMADGLEDRERMRETFGTYLDRTVARFILDGGFPSGGVEVDVSLLFCDVRGFTSFAERSEPAEVVANLNAMFETVVPIVERHGGHVDKFIGDGLLAVFGAPEGFADHADRALAAGIEMTTAVNGGDGPFRIGVGINSGRVIAGSIGGAGRLNFSVVGDAVNVAARVEAATRETGDDILVTAATRDRLVRPVELDSRGVVALRGKAEPIDLLAPLALGADGGDRVVAAPAGRS